MVWTPNGSYSKPFTPRPPSSTMKPESWIFSPFSSCECVIAVSTDCFLGLQNPELVLDCEKKENELLPGEAAGTVVITVRNYHLLRTRLL